MLNPYLKLDELASRFRVAQRLRIDDVFREDIAEDLYTCLERDVPWGIAYLEHKKPVIVPPEKLAELPKWDWARIHSTVTATPVDQFQYLYNSYGMVPAYLEKRDLHLPLHRVLEYLNSPEFINSIRAITGVQEITNTDAQATRYIPGCFLRKHSDYEEGKGREIAYVLNLTKNWYPEFGGQLQFIDEHDEITETFSPRFNSLSLFRVPMWHQVSYVVPYANQARYAITGWVRSGKSVIAPAAAGTG